MTAPAVSRTEWEGLPRRWIVVLRRKAKTPGTRDPFTGLPQSSWFAGTRGVIRGYGWDHNVDHTMAVLNATIDLPRTINMVG